SGQLAGTQLHGFWNLLAFILNAILFLMVGIALPAHRLLGVAGLALGAYVIMLAARALPVYGLLGLADIRGSRIPWSWPHMTFSGMWLRVGVALLLVVVAVAVVNYLRPIPSVSATPLLPASQVIPGTAPTLPWPSPGTGAVGVSGLGLVASSGNEQAIPAASVAKVMTALVVLEDKPLNKGYAGPI